MVMIRNPTDVILARIVYTLDVMVWLLPKIVIGAAVLALAWGFAELTIYMIRRWKRG